jgi:ferredoxin
MRLRIDEERCQGHGRCWDVAPDLVDSDDVGRGVVVTAEVPDALVAAAHTAVNACPEQAVILEPS